MRLLAFDVWKDLSFPPLPHVNFLPCRCSASKYLACVCEEVTTYHVPVMGQGRTFERNFARNFAINFAM